MKKRLFLLPLAAISLLLFVSTIIKTETKKRLSPASWSTPCIDTCDDIYEHCLLEYTGDNTSMKHCDALHIQCQKSCHNYSTLS